MDNSESFRNFAAEVVSLMGEIKMDKAEEPIVAPYKGGIDGLLSYITGQHASAATRFELGHRLIAEAERDMRVRPAFELELQLKEIYRQVEYPERPSMDVFDNVYTFLNVCKDSALLSKSALYLTDHGTIMLKILYGGLTSSVDIGISRYTYAIVDASTVSTTMGSGGVDDVKSVKEFYHQLKTFRK